MVKTDPRKQNKTSKSIKNVYIHKISSLMKLTGEQKSSFDCLNKVRRTISCDDKEGWALQRKENNKDAARKARQRKKIYEDLLEQSLENIQKLNEQSKQLERASEQLLSEVQIYKKEIKSQDDIDQYLIPAEDTIDKRNCSLATLDSQSIHRLDRIVDEIEKLILPKDWSGHRLPRVHGNSETSSLLSKMNRNLQSLPEIFMDLKSICSDYISLQVVTSSKPRKALPVDPYLCKTLMQEYYSQTICRKNTTDCFVDKTLSTLARIEGHFNRIHKIDV